MTDTPKITRPCDWCRVETGALFPSEHEFYPGLTRYFVKCYHCKCQGPFADSGEEEAIALWNDDAGREERHKVAADLFLEWFQVADYYFRVKHTRIAFATTEAIRLEQIRDEILELIQ